MGCQHPWGAVTVALRGLTLVLQGPGAAAVHAWAGPQAQQPLQLVAPADAETSRLLALQEIYARPEPTSLGIVETGAPEMAGKRRKAHLLENLSQRFSMPWWGWLVFAGILVVLACTFFGLGALHQAARNKAKSGDGSVDSPSPTSRGGFRNLVHGVTAANFMRRQLSTKSVGSNGGDMTHQETDKSVSPTAAALGARGQASMDPGPCLPCLPENCGNILAKAVKRAISSVDKKVIGVAVRTGNVRVNARSGLVEIEDVVLDNPEGYHSEHLLKVKLLAVQVSMAKYIFSRGKTCIIENMSISNVDIIYEKALTTSNVDYVISCMSTHAAETGDTVQAEDAGTLSGNLLGTMASTAHMITSTAAGSIAGSITEAKEPQGAASASECRPSSMFREGLLPSSSDIPLPRVARNGVNLVTRTATGVMDTAANLVGTAAFAGTSAVSSAANVVERTLATGAQGIATSTRTVVDTARRVSTFEAPPAPEVVREESPTPQRTKKKGQIFVVKRLNIVNVGVTLASNMVAGKGLRVSCGDIAYKDFSQEVPLLGGVDIVRFLLRAILLSAIKSMTSLGEFTLDTTGRALALGSTFAHEVRSGTQRAVNLI